MANITGTIVDAYQVSANQMPDIERVMQLLEPENTPVMTRFWFSNKTAKVVTSSTGKYSWFEDEYMPYQTTITKITGGATSEDNITVGDKTWINEGDLLLIEDTGEVVYVDSVANSQIDITKFASGNITACATGYITKIGSYNTELNGFRSAMSTQETEKYNYNTIFNETVSISGRVSSGKKYTTDDEEAYQLKKKMYEMKNQIERNFKFCTTRGTAGGSDSTRVTLGYGFLGQVSTNVTPYSSLSSDAIFQYIADVCKRGSNKKMHLCGVNHYNDIINAVKADSGSRFMLSETTTKSGLAIKELFSGFGTLELIPDNSMTGKFANYGLTMDAEHIQVRFQDADADGARKLRQEKLPKTIDKFETKILADTSLQVRNEFTHGVLYRGSL